MQQVFEGIISVKNSLQMNRPGRIVFSENSLYILDYDFPQIAILLQTQFGLLGYFLFKFLFGKKTQAMIERYNTVSLEEALTISEKNAQISYQMIESFELKTKLLYAMNKSIWFTVNGKEYFFTPDKNSFDSVAGVFRGVLPEKEKT